MGYSDVRYWISILLQGISRLIKSFRCGRVNRSVFTRRSVPLLTGWGKL